MLLFFLFTRFYLYVLLFFLFPRVVLLVVVAVVAGFAVVVVVVVMVETVNRAPVEDTGLRAAHLSVVKLGCIDSSLKQAA